MYENNYTIFTIGIYSMYVSLLKIQQSGSVIYYIKRLKQENLNTVLIDIEQAFDKTQYPFLVKAFII